jgi:hypothetical protein
MLRRRMFTGVIRIVLLGALLAAFPGVGFGAPGNGKTPIHGDPPCTASPNPVAVGQPFTLSASLLPTTDPVWLIVQAPAPLGTGTVNQVYVRSNGTWSGTEVATVAGTWSFTFSGLMNNNRYGAVSTCTVTAT